MWSLIRHKTAPHSVEDNITWDMLVTILLCCLPLSIPSLYMAYRLVKKRFLWSVFNQQAALILTVSGKMKDINIVALTDDVPRYNLASVAGHSYLQTGPWAQQFSARSRLSGVLSSPLLSSLLPWAHLDYIAWLWHDGRCHIPVLQLFIYIFFLQFDL